MGRATAGGRPYARVAQSYESGRQRPDVVGATELIAPNGQVRDMATIALWLGHERLETTHQYVEADLQLKEQALRKLDRLVSERSGSRRIPRC